MPCYHPIQAFRLASGEVSMLERGDVVSTLDLPCGRCIGCRLERSRQWATRISFESQLHDASCFLTLTYDSVHCPYPPSLRYSDVQKFLKRLRKRVGPVRFFAVGEYGEEHGRPHYHLCLFGYDFPDQKFWKMSGDNKLFRSAELEVLWPFGQSSVAELNFKTAAYCARYVLKKVTGDLADVHYRFVDAETGEVSMRVPEFCRMSLKPGIGGSWFDKYSSDVYGAGDYVVINGRRCKPPRYFDKLYKRLDEDAFGELKESREFRAYPKRSENMPSRLAAREKVQKAAISTLRRKL